jgi:phage shock protein A
MRLKLVEARQKLLEITAKSRAAAARREFVTRVHGMAFGTATVNFNRLAEQISRSEEETEALLELLSEDEPFSPIDENVAADLASLKEKLSHVTG